MTINQQNNRGSTLRRLAAIAYALDPAEFGELTARFIYYDFDVEPHYEMVDDCGSTIRFKVSTLSQLCRGHPQAVRHADLRMGG